MESLNINNLLNDIEFTINDEDYSAYVELVRTLVISKNIDDDLLSKIIYRISLLMLYSRLSKDTINKSLTLRKGEIIVDTPYKKELLNTWNSLQNLLIDYNLSII